MLIDLQSELGITDKFFNKKIDYLMGYNTELEIEVSEKTILDFHLSHRTNPEFKFEPKILLLNKYGNIYQLQIY